MKTLWHDSAEKHNTSGQRSRCSGEELVFPRERQNAGVLGWLFQEAQARSGRVLDARLSFVIKNRMEEMIEQLAAHPTEVDRIVRLDRLARLVMPLPLGLNLWKVQNTYWELVQQKAGEIRQNVPAIVEVGENWAEPFLELGRTLGFSLNRIELPAAAATRMAA